MAGVAYAPISQEEGMTIRVPPYVKASLSVVTIRDLARPEVQQSCRARVPRMAKSLSCLQWR